ncbi:uncharacterized protein LOC135166276 [Diachasmimorpha longicaudata]|uniref:uncharacterized protein LOC135166276 n=1 Tax=Diachasmimorpha longicaudata TaxID=58733 RepID=UPI0030B88D29
MSVGPPTRFLKHDTSRDLWQIIFSNKPGLSKNQVQSIFSRFGDIDKIIQTGTPHGFCIVKYTTREAAMKCITTDVADRDFITLSPFIQDYQKKNSKEGSEGSAEQEPSDANSNWAEKGTDGKSMKNNNHDIEDESTKLKDRPSIAQDYKEDSNLMQTKDFCQFSKTEYSQSKSNINKPRDQSIAADSGFAHSNSLNNVHSNKATASGKSGMEEKTQFKSLNDRINYLRCQRPLRVPDIGGKNGQGNEDRSSISSDSSSLGGQKVKTELNQSNDSEVAGTYGGSCATSADDKDLDQAAGLPALIDKKAILQKNNSATTLEPICNGLCCQPYAGPSQAHEVIVANIDKTCDVGFIMNLFKDYQPALVTSIREHKKTLRYCHVYFESSQRAQAVEKIFDHIRIHGKELIVLRPETMVP